MIINEYPILESFSGNEKLLISDSNGETKNIYTSAFTLYAGLITSAEVLNLINRENTSSLVLLNSVTTSASISTTDLKDFGDTGFNKINFEVVGHTSGIYNCEIRLYTSEDLGSSLSLVGKIFLSNINYYENVSLKMSNKLWAAQLYNVTGTLSPPGIKVVAYV